MKLALREDWYQSPTFSIFFFFFFFFLVWVPGSWQTHSLIDRPQSRTNKARLSSSPLPHRQNTLRVHIHNFLSINSFPLQAHSRLHKFTQKELFFTIWHFIHFVIAAEKLFSTFICVIKTSFFASLFYSLLRSFVPLPVSISQLANDRIFPTLSTNKETKQILR